MNSAYPITGTERALVAILTNSNDIPANRRDEILALLTNAPKAEEATPLPDRIITVPETASALRQTKRTVHRLCNEGHLVRVKFPGRKNAAGILASSVSALLQKCAVSGAAP